MKYIIEHLESRLYKWCFIEYKHASDSVGKENIIFTNVKNKKDQEKLAKIGSVKAESIRDLKLKKALVLDPDSEKTLSPEDNKRYDYLIFGGILGDYPRKHRTEEMLSQFLAYEKRDLGKPQMSTNTAVYVAKKIMDGTPLSKLQFVKQLVVPVGKGEEIILPFRFVKENGSIVLPKEYIKLIKEKGGF